ncbi:MAG: zinc ribbon domain-containing protein [Gemmatimonadaceae bacterium]
MPLYEFRCPSGHEFEKFYRSIASAPSEETCPECQQLASRRMSAAGLVFKGSGFYITDYGKDGKKAERDAVAASNTKAAAEKSDSAKSDGAKFDGVKSDGVKSDGSKSESGNSREQANEKAGGDKPALPAVKSAEPPKSAAGTKSAAPATKPTPGTAKAE